MRLEFRGHAIAVAGGGRRQGSCHRAMLGGHDDLRLGATTKNKNPWDQTDRARVIRLCVLCGDSCFSALEEAPLISCRRRTHTQAEMSTEGFFRAEPGTFADA